MRPSRTTAHALAFAALASALSLPATTASAEGYVLGAGSWPCTEIVEIMETDDPSPVGQVAGWVFGTWSAARFQRDPGFVDIVEQVGGDTILHKAVEEYRKAPPQTLFYTVVNSMIANTK